jgi:hypothetical protein
MLALTVDRQGLQNDTAFCGVHCCDAVRRIEFQPSPQSTRRGRRRWAVLRSYVFFVRWGGKPIEFEKGKNGIAVPSLSKIPVIIDILITAVRNGELDAQLAQAKRPTTALKSLKAA